MPTAKYMAPQDAELAAEVYRTAFEATSTFEGSLGAALAYLLGSILTGQRMGLFPKQDPSHAEALAILQEIFCSSHRVWYFIEIDETP